MPRPGRPAAGIDPCGENGEVHTFVHAGCSSASRSKFAAASAGWMGDFAHCDPFLPSAG